MRKLLSIIAMLVLSVTMLMAQTKIVTGNVISAEDGEPVIGATVIVPGTTLGAVTDINGNFSLRVPENTKTVYVSFVGMEAAEVPIKGKSITVTLAPASEVLDDVVVVAYGT